MKELHAAMGFPMFDAMFAAAEDGKPGADIWRGDAMREPIFYGGESAYSFQYRDLVVEKYRADDPWLVQNKGFSIAHAQAVARAMCALLDEKVTGAFAEMKQSGVPPTSWLPAFEQAPDEIAFRANVPLAQVQAFLDAFTLRGDNESIDAVVLSAGFARLLVAGHLKRWAS